MLARTMEKLSAMNTTFRFALMELPNELIAHIIEFIDSRDTLRRLSCTCRRVQQLTEPMLYRTILIRSGHRAERVLDALRSRLERALAVH